IVALAASAAAATPQPQFALDPHAGSWLRGPSLPEPRQDAASAVLDGRIYIIGGFGDDSRATDTTFVLEPPAGVAESPPPNQEIPPIVPLGTWMTAQPIPEPVDHAAAASLDGYLYVAGGSVENVVSNKFWRYDPIADAWTSIAPMPVARYGATMQAFDGKLYLFGGATSHGDDEMSIEVYDPSTRAWTLRSNELGVERYMAASALFDDRIALVGGRSRAEQNMTSCDLYDPARDRWTTCSNMHDARSGFGLADVDRQLFAIGGVNILTGLVTQTTEISGVNGQGWMDGHWLPSPRQGMSVAVLGHTVWVVGGSFWDATSPTTSVLRYVIPLVRVKLQGRAGQ
ncbi:MAG TPA: kelch repeat-containing protein, partial [Candidatus Eremiobacteraceae bacterium]|nr:kelch repeat-containing protein [Candidatus Eremiobacteraceae bacterium]